MQPHFPSVGKPAGLVLKSSYMFGVPSGGKNYIDSALWNTEQVSFGMWQEIEQSPSPTFPKWILQYFLNF